MKRYPYKISLSTILVLVLLFNNVSVKSQNGQIGINRIGLMPDLPAPLSIIDWDAVTVGYDAFVFDLEHSGQYLPLVRIGDQGQFNYPDNTPIFMDTYVGGENHLNVAEAINIMPAIVGASLAGIDKSNQDGNNWVAMAKDFFNKKNGQDVYLNNYSTTSGSDWWYDVMPNVYFYQMRYLYPQAVPEFEDQFTSVADRWLYSLQQLGGSSTPWSVPNMNYRAFNLATGQPLASGVPEPESAGSIAWLLYNAYLETNNRKYLLGTQQAMDFLEAWESNPSYELQLPYGTLTAAKLNAKEGTSYNVNKMLNWCFDFGALRGWGAITGNWGGYDVSGLIGEANDNGNDYAFIMNGFQQIAALAPLPKYDKRYARDIGKWILNITNASRLFYRNQLPPENQDSYQWSLTYDPQAVIPHESLKESWLGKSPFARGDAITGGWAETNLSLYSGSSVGYLAAVVDTTNIQGILKIDLNKTDFYAQNELPAFLFFNPHPGIHQVNIDLPTGSWGIYEALTETILNPQISGQFQLIIPGGEARLIRLFNSSITPVPTGSRLLAGDQILDYHYGYDYSIHLRFKSLATNEKTVLTGTEFTTYAEPGNIEPEETVEYRWFINDTEIAGENQKTATLPSPLAEGGFVVKCTITSLTETVTDTLHLNAVDFIPVPPSIISIESEFAFTPTGGSNTFSVIVDPISGDTNTFIWEIEAGVLSVPSGNNVTWQAPLNQGVYTLTVTVSNQYNSSSIYSIPVLVKDTTLQSLNPLIWYPLDYNEFNAARNEFHAIRNGGVKAPDARDIPSLALRFSQGSDILYAENSPSLNFSEAVTLSCWIKCEQLGSERYIISHGSYQQRYKLSVTPEGYLRWTVKTSTGIADLDGSFPIELNRFYHVTAAYTGYSLELYIDGIIDSFSPHQGSLLSAEKNLTIGRMDNSETLYSWRGSVDEVKIWDSEIPVGQIAMLKNEWGTSLGESEIDMNFVVWPNPSNGIFHIEPSGQHIVTNIELFNSVGQSIPLTFKTTAGNQLTVKVDSNQKGICFLKFTVDGIEFYTRKIQIL